MKKNTNSRKISLIKNNLWKKQLRRRERIISGHKNVVDNAQDYLDEINLLFPNLNNEDKELNIQLTDPEKKVITVTVGAGLYDNDVYEELKKYKDVPMKGFRQASKKVGKNSVQNQQIQKKLGSLTLMDFRYGPQLRESLIHSKYFNGAKEKAIEMNPEFKDLLCAPFNLKKEKICSFNVIFYSNKNEVDNTINDFMKNNMTNPEVENDESTSQE